MGNILAWISKQTPSDRSREWHDQMTLMIKHRGVRWFIVLLAAYGALMLLLNAVMNSAKQAAIRSTEDLYRAEAGSTWTARFGREFGKDAARAYVGQYTKYGPARSYWIQETIAQIFGLPAICTVEAIRPKGRFEEIFSWYGDRCLEFKAKRQNR